MNSVGTAARIVTSQTPCVTSWANYCVGRVYRPCLPSTIRMGTQSRLSSRTEFASVAFSAHKTAAACVDDRMGVTTRRRPPIHRCPPDIVGRRAYLDDALLTMALQPSSTSRTVFGSLRRQGPALEVANSDLVEDDPKTAIQMVAHSAIWASSCEDRPT